MKVFSLNTATKSFDEICEILRAGGVLVCPSDTTYGILVDATNPQAVEKLLALKDRPRGKAISVFVSGFEMMGEYADTSKLTPEVRSLLPGSYTLVLPSLHKASQLLEAEDGTLGVRLIGKHVPNSTFQVPSNNRNKDIQIGEFVTELVARYGKPLTATSANISGKGLCYSPQAFLNQLSDKKKQLIDAIIDAGELPHHPPSTVIHLAGHVPVVLRANDQDFVHHETLLRVKLRKGKHTTRNTEPIDLPANAGIHGHSSAQRSGLSTEDVAHRVFDIVKVHFGEKPIVILLDGELGGGKTTWTKYFAKLLGVENIVSPTYTYECEYPLTEVKGIRTFKHYDLYNVALVQDLKHLAISDHLTPNTIVCIEWPGQLTDEDRTTIAHKAIVVRILFEYMTETTRKVSVWWN